jgi:cephalosporin hydroxylase
MRRFLVSHLVYRWHDRLVPPLDRITIAHRGTNERRSVDAAWWSALERALRRPLGEDEIAGALGDPDEVRALIEARFLVEPERDFWTDYRPDLGAADPDLARDRLRWSRDVIEPHGLWMYPTWLGFPVLQWPPDLVWMQMLLAEVRPRAIVETGVYRGGGVIFYASMCELLGLDDCQVIGVELRLDPEVRRAVLAHRLGRRIALLEGSSTDPAIVAEVSRRAGGPGTHVVALDSDHSSEHVRAELEAYAPLVAAAGKLVVFDTSMSLAPRFAASNPHLAVRGFLADHPGWRISPWAGAAFVSACEDGILERLPP